MKIAALIQARMGSTRLPGKVLMGLNGKPVLWHVVDRLRRSVLLNQIIIATTTDPKDDAIQAFCQLEGVDFFRGSEDDVLDRYYRAATHFKADQIVRITSDCPLIDPVIVDSVIRKHLDSKADYSSNTLKRTFPRGLDVEVFSFLALARASREAKEISDREHVTPYFYKHPELFRLISVEAADFLRRPDIRICVDTKEDLELARLIYRELKSTPMGLKEIVAFFNDNPESLKINAAVQQKSI